MPPRAHQVLPVDVGRHSSQLTSFCPLSDQIRTANDNCWWSKQQVEYTKYKIWKLSSLDILCLDNIGLWTLGGSTEIPAEYRGVVRICQRRD